MAATSAHPPLQQGDIPDVESQECHPAAVTLAAFVDRAGDAAADTARLVRDGVARTPDLDLPQEAERYRAEARAFVASLDGLDATARRTRLVESGYLVPHWPPPWGRDASAAEQLVVEQELRGADVPNPSSACPATATAVDKGSIRHTPQRVEGLYRVATGDHLFSGWRTTMSRAA